MPLGGDGDGGPREQRLGLCIHSLMIRGAADRASGAEPAINDPLTFLEYAHGLGAAGIQVGLGLRDADYVSRFRERAETLGLFVEGIALLPKSDAEAPTFEAAVRTAVAMGARVIRTVLIPGRRYESFPSMEAFRELDAAGRRALERAEPIAARHRVCLAVENHKDHRVAEKLAILEAISSEWVGLCVDTGNDLSLLEDPMALVEAYAPWAVCVHLKDMAVREEPEGFLLAEVPLGEGFLDLPAMLRILRGARPEAHFTLEMITRDPLRVPCLSEGYWAALDGVPGRDLARTLAMVRRHAAPQPLPRVAHLPMAEQLSVEEQNIRRCLAVAARYGL